jgi:nucleotide-binding universal stress UspA family protein
MFKHILLPTDGSDTAMRAVARGVELAAQLGAQVTVMTAIAHFPTGIMASGYRPPEEPQEPPGLQTANYWLDQAEAVARGAGVPCQRIVLRDKPVYRAILEAAQTCNADLIVMGTHGMGLVERLLIGSQTQRVLAHTHIPVLTLH